MLFLDGAYIDPIHGKQVRFRRVKAPTRDEFTQLTHTIAHCIGRYLERRGLFERYTGNSYLTAQALETPSDDPSHHLLGHSITSATAPALLYLLHPRTTRQLNCHDSLRPPTVSVTAAVNGLNWWFCGDQE